MDLFRSSFHKTLSIIGLMFSIPTLWSLFYFTSPSVLRWPANTNLFEKQDFAQLILEVALLGVLGTCILCTSLVIPAIICYIEDVKKNHSVFSCIELVDYIDNKLKLGMIIPFVVYYCQFLMDNKFILGDLLLLQIFVAAISAFVWSSSTLLFPYDDIDVSLSLNYENSIGAAYALGAHKSYYEIVSKKFISSLQKWEKEKHCDIPVQKLITICPLSCYVEGTLNHRSENIKIKDSYISHICDQGANMNRQYKHTIYEVASNHENTCVVAEFASPLGVLWDRKNMMGKEFVYIRDCFIKTLKRLLKDYPCCVVVEFDGDDRNPYEWDRLLQSVVAKHLNPEESKMKDI